MCPNDSIPEGEQQQVTPVHVEPINANQLEQEKVGQITGLQQTTTLEESEQQRLQELQKKQQALGITELKTGKNWREKLGKMFQNSGYVSIEEMPEELPEDVLKDNTKLLAGRKIGNMEMGKARKEYRQKLVKARRQTKIINEFHDKMNEEEIDAFRWDEKEATDEELKKKNDAVRKKMKSFRDEWRAVHVFTEAEERRKFMEDSASGEKTRIRDSLRNLFDKLSNVDVSIFTYHNEEEMLENYETKMRYIQAGYCLRNLLGTFRSAGGSMDKEELCRMNALADFYEGLEGLYSAHVMTKLHPQYLLMRDKDYEGVSAKKLAAREEKINTEIKERQRKDGGTSPAASRLENLKGFIGGLLHDRSRHGDLVNKGGEHIKEMKKDLSLLIKQYGENSEKVRRVKEQIRRAESSTVNNAKAEKERSRKQIKDGETAPAYLKRLIAWEREKEKTKSTK